ncbi:MAG: GatB/YqeY domain-containing protein [Proteobacteria bacterium]|nr:GatB/YqeY domain-containing protein [Pseudomonadota bacterium]
MTTSPLKNRIQEDMKNAMRSKDTERLGVIRLLLAAMKQREVDERIDLSDNDIIQILNKMIKQRLDSASQFQVANRLDLASKEKKEIEILEQYLPTQMSEAEVDIVIQNAINTTRPTSMQEMGKVMAYLKEQLAGRADMAKVSAKIKEILKELKT